MKRISFKVNDRTFREMREEADEMGMDFFDYTRETINTGRSEQKKVSRKALTICTAGITASVMLSSLFFGLAIKDATSNRIHYLAVTGQAEAKATDGLYTELLDIDSFNNSVRAALDERENYYMDTAERFIKGGINMADFENEEDTRDFVNFFTDTYALTFRNAYECSFDYVVNDDGTYTLKYNKEEVNKNKEETPERRVALMQAMIDRYKLHDYSNAYEEVDSIVGRIHDKLVYNIDKISSSSYEALQTGEGVCVHFSSAFYVIANTEGIPTELVFGKYTCDDGKIEWHSWCEVHLDGVTYTVDPTSCGFVNENDLWRYEVV